MINCWYYATCVMFHKFVSSFKLIFEIISLAGFWIKQDKTILDFFYCFKSSVTRPFHLLVRDWIFSYEKGRKLDKHVKDAGMLFTLICSGLSIESCIYKHCLFVNSFQIFNWINYKIKMLSAISPGWGWWTGCRAWGRTAGTSRLLL